MFQSARAAFSLHPCARAAVVLLAALPGARASAEPLLGSGRPVEGVQIFADSRDRRTFYYGPGRLTVAADPDGRPQFSFLQMRYTGTAATGDAGLFRTQSILSFRVVMGGAAGDQLARVRAKLSAGASPVLLRPLPIRQVRTQLNFAPLADASPSPPAEARQPAGEGALEAREPETPAAGLWRERLFTVQPDERTSQALWEALKRGSVFFSLSYSFYADGIPPQDRAGHKGPFLVGSDTLPLTVDAVRYPQLLRRIDVDESIPAGYAVLSIACYDFNNDLRPDLHVRVVEVEAKSVGGRPITSQAVFSRATPEAARASVRFPFAVSFRHGYRYRVRDVTAGGDERVGEWREGRPWTQLLDVTTPPGERPRPSDTGDDP